MYLINTNGVLASSKSLKEKQKCSIVQMSWVGKCSLFIFVVVVVFFFRCFDFGNEAPVNSRRVTEIGTVKGNGEECGYGGREGVWIYDWFISFWFFSLYEHVYFLLLLLFVVWVLLFHYRIRQSSISVCFFNLKIWSAFENSRHKDMNKIKKVSNKIQIRLQ